MQLILFDTRDNRSSSLWHVMAYEESLCLEKCPLNTHTEKQYFSLYTYCCSIIAYFCNNTPSDLGSNNVSFIEVNDDDDYVHLTTANAGSTLQQNFRSDRPHHRCDHPLILLLHQRLASRTHIIVVVVVIRPSTPLLTIFRPGTLGQNTFQERNMHEYTRA